MPRRQNLRTIARHQKSLARLHADAATTPIVDRIHIAPPINMPIALSTRYARLTFGSAGGLSKVSPRLGVACRAPRFYPQATTRCSGGYTVSENRPTGSEPLAENWRQISSGGLLLAMLPRFRDNSPYRTVTHTGADQSMLPSACVTRA